jgi:hypothetical protein
MVSENGVATGRPAGKNAEAGKGNGRRNGFAKDEKIHYGQVVPIEDVERILEFTNTVVRAACICRHVTLGREKRYCYGVSFGSDGGKIAEILRGLAGSFVNGPNTAGLW